ncbi:MAG TPA: hypothetical protein PK668_18790 [Myxococcota bacterium]|nr:hypothetical protein [Myxococcota bacterium]HRY96600.1 hypothetical protein [Myxococcota bacterium]
MRAFLRPILAMLLPALLTAQLPGCMAQNVTTRDEWREIGRFDGAETPTGKTELLGQCQEEPGMQAVCRLTRREECALPHFVKKAGTHFVVREQAGGFGPWFPAVLGGFLLIGGSILAIVGAAAEPDPVDGPSETTLEVLKWGGVGGVGASVPVLIWFTAEAARNADYEEEIPEVTVEKGRDLRWCRETPAADVELSLVHRSLERPLPLGRTDARGELRIGLKERLRRVWEEPSAWEDAVIHSEGNRLATLPLHKLKAVAFTAQARVAMEAGGLDKAEAALRSADTFDKDTAGLAELRVRLQQARASERQKQDEIDRAERQRLVAAAVKQIEKALAKGDLDAAAETTDEAAAPAGLLPKDDPGALALAALTAKVDLRRADAQLAKARTVLARGDLEAAREAANECLGMDSERHTKSCQAVLDQADAVEARREAAAERAEKQAERTLLAWGKAHHREAKLAARSEILENLRSPMEAVFQVVNVVANRGDLYIVHVVVDAPNAFGQMIRDSFCVALRLDRKKPSMYHVKTGMAVQECSRYPDPSEFEAMKGLNGWPSE